MIVALTGTYIGSDRIYNTSVAFQFTSLATDARGHIGMTTLFGGGTGTSHTFPSAGVDLNDDVSRNQPWTFGVNAFGAGNACIDTNNGNLYRSGDYTTTRAYRPTNTAFLGYNFVLTANAGACNTTAPVAAHEALFGRKRSSVSAKQCFGLAADTGRPADHCALLDLPSGAYCVGGSFHGMALPRLALVLAP